MKRQYEQTVAASIIERGDDRVPRREVTIERKLPNFGREVVTVALLAFIFAAAAGIGYQFAVIWLLVAGIVAFGSLGLLFIVYLYNAYKVLELPALDDEVGEAEDEPEPDLPADFRTVQILLSNGRVVEFVQPKAGEAAAWFRAVLEGQATLSQNTGIKRGWTREGYRAMLASLRENGLVQTGQNNTPIFTHYGEMRIKEWLAVKKN